MPMMIPTSKPKIIADTITERCLGADQRAMRACMAGRMTPSPNPERIRRVRKAAKWNRAKTGVSREMIEESRMQPPNSHLPPNRSASQPPGIYKKVHKSRMLRRQVKRGTLDMQRNLIVEALRYDMRCQGSHSFICHQRTYPRIDYKRAVHTGSTC